MGATILQELETIKGYLFIIMVLLFFRVVIKSLQSIQVVLKGFKTAFDQAFSDKMERFIELGKFEKVVAHCNEKLESYPSHLDAVWFSAIANYYLEKDEQALIHFERVIYLCPSWESSANAYIEKIKTR